MINKIVNKNAGYAAATKLKFSESSPTNLNSFKIFKEGFAKNSAKTSSEIFSLEKPLSNRLLSKTNTNFFSRLLPHLKPVSLSIGENLYQPDDRIDEVYFLESAVVSNLQMLEDGRMVEISMIGSEGVIGIPTICSIKSAKYWTEVIVAGSAFKLNVQMFKQEFGCNLFFQNSILRYLNFYLEQISQKVICNNYHQLKERFCCWLLMLQNRCGRNKFSLTHEQAARCLGVHRPGISNIAKNLREKKIIDYSRGKIVILDYEEMKNLACSCFCSIQ